MSVNRDTAEPKSASAGEQPLIEICRAHKRYGGIVAVDDVSLEMGEGRFVTLLGPSGCGKTTLLRMIGGLEETDGGVIRVAGRPVASFSPVERPTRMVFQSYALFPHMTVERNIAYGLRRRKLREADIKSEVAAQLDVVGLSDKAKSYPSELSGGQQQRVALARALVTKPKVLLLDEPLAALDLKLRQRMQAELKVMQRTAGITFVFVTHDQHEALALSDEVVVMRKGRVAQRGSPSEVYHQPVDRYVAEFVGDTSVLEATVLEAEGGKARIETPAGILEAFGRNVRAGDKVHAVIRPEEIRRAGASTGKTPHTNILQATVEAAVFRGADLLVDFRTVAGDIRLQASIASGTPEIADMVPGNAVLLELPAAALWLIPAQEPAKENQ